MKKFIKRFVFVILLLVALAGGAALVLNYLGVDILAGITGTAVPSATSPDTSAQSNSSPESEDDLAQFEIARPFNPEPDGFGFRNFSGRFKEGDLTIAEVQEMFGDSVCTRLEGTTCIPHPKVITWIDNMNTMMNTGGHCVGFTVASNQLHTDILSVSELGADITYNLERKALPVLKTISQSYAANYASNVQAQEVKDKTPAEIIEALLLLDEPVDIGIFYPKYGENGHSVLGYNVTNEGDGIYHIWVYDSNRPGTDNIIVVDTNADTWFYPDAAVNPDEDSTDYKGDAATKSLTYFPSSAYSQELACPAEFAELCPSASDAESFTVVTATGEGQLVAETADGQIGQTGDTVINTVPGGELLPSRGELFSRLPPILLIPSTELLAVQAQGAKVDVALAISLANPDYSVVVDGLVAQPGQIEQVNFDPTAQQAEFIAGGPQRPFFEFLFNQDGVLYSAQLTGLEFSAGQDLTVRADADSGDLQWTSSSGLTGAQATLFIARLTADGEAVLATQALGILPGGTLTLDLDNWNGSGSLSVSADVDGDGRFESTTEIESVPIATVLPGIGSPNAIIDTLQSVAPYLDDTDTTAVATTLPTLGFSGTVLGEAYLQLPSLQPDNLTAAVGELPPREIGHFIVASNLDTNQREALLEALPPEVRSVVERAITDQEAVLEAVDEWEFRNPPNDDDLPAFLEEQGLDDDQLSDFLAQFVPPQEPVATVAPTAAPATNTPPPTNTPAPIPTDTPLPTATLTPLPTATNTPAPTPTSTPIVDVNAGACSIDGAVATEITFVNQTSSDVTIYWVNYACGEESVETLAPGASYTEQTFTDHPWRVRSSATGDLLPLEAPDGLFLTYINNSTSGVTVNVRE